MISEKLQKEREIIVSLFNKVPEYLGNRYPDNFDAPTKAQFCYAVKFGIDMRWQTFQSTSAAIDDAKAKGITPYTNLTDAELFELYRYMCRGNNRRYSFLEDLPDSPWLDPRRFKPVPPENMKNKAAFAAENSFDSDDPPSAPVNKTVLTPEQQKQANWGCFIVITIFLLLFYACRK